MRVLILALATFLFMSASSAQAYEVGMSFYALNAFNEEQCERTLKAFERAKTPALAHLWGTFGSDTTCLQKFLSRYADRPHILQIHISNQTCIRDRDCTAGELFSEPIPLNNYIRLVETRDPTMIAAIEQRIKEVAEFVRDHRNENTTVLLSTGLEDDYTELAYETVLVLLNRAQLITPFLTVRSPQRGRGTYKTLGGADFIELHSFTARFKKEVAGRCIVNNDGNNIVFRGKAKKQERMVHELGAFVKRYKRRDCIVFLWWSRPQGLASEADEDVSPQQRQFFLGIPELRKVSSHLP